MSKTPANFEAIYPLSPMQQGMLFHSLYAPESGVYVEQMACTLQGALNVPAFRHAWQRVVERQPILRTAFSWKSTDRMLQVVRSEAVLPFAEEDWRALSDGEQEARLSAFLAADRQRGFDLSKAPLMRLALIRMGDTRFTFLSTHHHALLDGWSLPLLLNEVFLLYRAVSEGRDLYLPPPRPYRDYIAWLQKQDIRQAEEAWRSVLSGLRAPTPLGVDHPAPANSTPTYAEHERQLSEQTTANLLALSRKHDLTVNTILQGAWALLLSRYSGEPDVVFGATVSGRPPDLDGVESMIGIFINTLPVRVSVTADSRVVPWLQAIQAQQAHLRQFEYTPLVQIQAWTEVPRTLPLFDSILIFENYPVNVSLTDMAPGVRITDVRSLEQTNYPLTLVAGLDGSLVLKASYDTRRFDLNTMERLLGHLAALLDAFVTQPQGLLADIAVLTANEWRQIEAWNSTAADYPADTCIHHLFEAQAQRTPAAVALTLDAATLTYDELNRRANQLAHYLRRLGIGPETLVGVYLERSFDMVVAVLGVLKAGGAYVPLDVAYPRQRLAEMIEDSGLTVILTQAALASALPPAGVQLVLVDVGAAVIAQESNTNPCPAAQSDNLAYVIYTSGSTGRPKGTLLQHGGLCNLALAEARDFQIGPGSRVLQFSSFSFDAWAGEVFPALATGATLCLTTREITLSPVDLADFMRRQGVTTAIVPPSVLHLLSTDGLPALQTVVSAADRCPPDVARRWASGRRFFNGYGPTETTVGAAWYEVRDPSSLGMSVPIGRPIANVQIYILDWQGQPAPIGVAGELHIGGAGLARGYLNRPEFSAEKFVPNRFSADPAARLYKTGDLGRYLPDGNIEFVGRLDFQVKIRGLRVELGEIETILRQHPGVHDAVVVAQQLDGHSESRLTAFIIPARANDVDAAALRAHLRSRLPEHMIPAAFVSMDAFPMTASGKVDRRALPAPDLPPEAGPERTAARTPTEELLSNIWAQVLNVPRVGAHDSFFDLGGHSLLVTQVISRVRDAFQVELPLRTLFEAPTIASFAERVEAMRRAGVAAAPPISRMPRDHTIPLSFAQQRLWFLEQLAPGNLFYNLPNVVRIKGKLNLALLEQSLNEIIRRHEVLRTSFPSTDGQPAQVIAPSLKASMPSFDLRHAPGQRREEEALRLATEDARRPFDLSQGPLLRAMAIRTADDEHIIAVTIHHIIADGWSINVLIRELMAVYSALVSGQPVSLPDLAIQYADFALWQRQWLTGETLDAQLAYWRERLAGSPPRLELPTDRPRPALQTPHGAHHKVAIPAALTQALNRLSRQEGVTLFMTILAVFQTLLHRYSGQDDICVGTPIANRTRAEIEGLIGFFVNTLVLRGDLSGNPTFRQLLRRVRETALGAYAHQDLPFEMLVEAIQPQRDLSHTPLFQVMLVLTNTPMTTLELPELTVTPLDIETGMATFDMTLSLTEIPEGLVGTVQYNTDLFDARTIEDMMVHFQVLLEAVVANPEQCISVLPLLTPAERQRILVDWNQTAAPFPDSACIHHLIGNWVAVQPAAPALVFDDQIISYAEMSQRANQLAHSLQAMGAAPDTIVALCLDRSPQMVIGLLAILTAGAAYLPLDPAYPPDRLAFMIDDAQAPILVTDHDHRPLLPAFRGHTIALDRDGPAIAHQPTHPPASPVSAANLAYVIYTSGSTGKPKGALLQHRGLVNLAAWQQRAFHITPDSRILQFSPLSFDASVWEIVMALANGATLVLARRETLADGLSLLHLLRSARISHVTLPPSVLSVLPQEHLPDLTTIIAAGEACPRRLVQLWGHNRQFVNAYGPTETTVCAAMAVCSPDDPTAPPIGRPIANTRLYVLDAHLQPTPIGVPGQLCVAGVSLARGYHNRPDLTADRFIPDPFCTTPGARLYKTGDIVRYRPDGQLDFLGRADAQVKVRGFRIELGEIEAALRQIPGVRDAAVVVRDVAGDKRLAAYLVPHTMPGPSQESVHAHLQASLPDYMIPAAIVVLERWPLSPAGKIDRRALPAPEGLGGERVYVGPRTAVEERLAELCATLLGVERVGVEDSFFELGGHSLLATQLMARVRDAWQVEIPLRTLFERPTIAGLAEAIEQARPVASRDLDKIAQALAAVQALSDAQTKGMLAPEQRPGVQQ